MLPDWMKQAKVLVSVGSGGVGKTTVSAAMGLAASMEGKKVLVMTIDPARRLANALGLQALDDGECEIPKADWCPEGVETEGQLFAMMLDQKQAFDRIVERFSPTPESAQRIRDNRWYQQMSTALAGAQDFMAMERLYEMSTHRDYDLIVLDTPPTSNAIDFLNAPEKIKGLLQMRSFQWIQDKLAEEGSTTGRLLRWSGGALLKLLGKVTGQEVMQEIWTLLEDLSVLSDSFQEHSEQAMALLQSEHCHFVQISVAKQAPLKEALFLQETLLDAGMTVSGVVLNRVPGYLHHNDEWIPLPEPSIEQDEQAVIELAKRVSPNPNRDPDVLALLLELGAHVQQFRERAELASEAVVFLKEHVEGDPWIHQLPLISDDISNLQGLQRIAHLLMEPSLTVSC